MSVLADAQARAISSFSRSSVVLGAGASAAILGAVAVYAPKYAVAALLAAALVALAFWRLAASVVLFTAVTLPQNLPGFLGVTTVAKPLGLVIVAAWVAKVVARRGSTRLLARDSPALFWVVVAFVVLAAASALWAPSLHEVRYQLVRLVPDAFLLLVVYTAVSTYVAFRNVVWAYLVATAVSGGYSIGVGGYGSQGRLYGLSDPNIFAALLSPAIIVALFLVLTPRARRVRIAAAGVMVIDVVALILTQSRGGIVGLGVGLTAAIFLGGAARPRIVAAVLLVFAVGLVYYFEYAPSHLKVSGSLASQSSGRSDEWKIAVRMFADHPLKGVGLGNYVVVEPSYATRSFNLNFVHLIVNQPLVAHNSFLEIAAELGIVGIVLFVTILGLAAARARSALASLARAGDALEFYARGLLAGVIGMFGAYVFLSDEYQKQLWLLLGLLAVLPAIAAGKAARESI